MNQPDPEQSDRVSGEAQEACAHRQEPGKVHPLVFILAVVGFGPSIAWVPVVLLLAPLDRSGVEPLEWWVRVILASLVGVGMLCGLVYGLYVSVSKRTIRLELEGLKIVRRPLPIGWLERYERGQMVGAEVGVPSGAVAGKGDVAAVLLVLATGERRVLLFTHTREEAATLTWEITDYYGFAATIKHVTGVHSAGCWYPVVNGQIDLGGVTAWPQERVVKESNAPWRVDHLEGVLAVRACRWYRDYFQLAGAAVILILLVTYVTDEVGVFACILVPSVVFGLPFLLVMATLKRNSQTIITADSVSTKNGLWQIGFTRRCKPEDIERIRFLASPIPSDKTGKAEIFLAVSTRADAAEMYPVARGFKSAGQLAGLAELIASALPARVAIGLDGAVPAQPEQPAAGAKAEELKGQEGLAEAGQTEVHVPARDLTTARRFALYRRWPTGIFLLVTGLAISFLPLMVLYVNLYERPAYRLSTTTQVVMWMVIVLAFCGGVIPAAWVLIRRSYFVVRDGRLKFDIHTVLKRRTVHDFDASKVEGLWVLVAPGLNQVFYWPCWLCVKSGGRYAVYKLGFWETVRTAQRAMRQARHALGIQPMEQETCFGVVHRGVYIDRDEHNKHRLPESPGFEQVERGRPTYKRVGESSWRSFKLRMKWLNGAFTLVMVLLVVVWVLHVTGQNRWIDNDLTPMLIFFTLFGSVVYVFRLLSSMTYETIEVGPMGVSRFSIAMMKFNSARFSTQEIKVARVYIEHRFSYWLGRYEVWFTIAVPDELTQTARVAVDRIGSYEEACEMLEGLRAGGDGRA